MKSLEERLIEYGDSDYYGFHMPGHKRNKERFGGVIPYGMDITEIEGFDDLHHPEGILLEGKKRAADLFKSDESFYLINGSTSGNMAAVLATTELGDKILMARNNHKSVYNAVFLNRLQPVYIYPEYDKENGISGEVSKEEIKTLLEQEKDIKAVVIVSPTYDGVVSDVAGIAMVAHSFGIPLIVDEAHGAHFGMHKYFPDNSNESGADLVIHSVHKTLPSLTQTGLLHVNGDIVDREKLKRYLKMLQSSSPSYILMSSIDKCVNILAEQRVELFNSYVEKLDEIRCRLKEMKQLHLIETEHYDKSKVIISTRECERYENGITSKQLYEILLEKYHIQMEMCGANYVTAMTSVGDTKEGLERLVLALLEIDETCKCVNTSAGENQKIIDYKIEKEIIKFPELRQADVDEEGSEWFYYVYPPGIPFVVPGEMITEEVRQLMERLKGIGFTIHKG